MNCCERCFKDFEIKAIIKGFREKGDCDFCQSKNAYVCDVSKNEDLKDNFENLADIYTPVCDIGSGYPRERADLLKNILSTQWNIFNLKPDSIYKFLVSLLPEKYTEQPKLFDEPVGIAGSIKEDYLKE